MHKDGYTYTDFHVWLRKKWPYIIIILLLLSAPSVVSCIRHYDRISFGDMLLSILVTISLFLLPVVFFFWNVRAYLWILIVLIILMPLILFSIVLFDVEPGWLFVSLILQTNIAEAKEMASGYWPLFVPIELVYIGLYVFAVKRLRINRVPLKTAVLLSVGSLIFIFSVIILDTRFSIKGNNAITKQFPLSLMGGIATVVSYKVAVDNSNFQFHAYQKDTLTKRQIHVLVIGESSRFDHWQINGYSRPTSPKLMQQQNLSVFSNMLSGGYVTWMAVPQMITRANPDNIDAQFHEKSILSAFKDVHFKTAWLSNQSDHELYFSGTTPLHAKTADYSVFSESSSALDIIDIYDSRLLPMLDSILSKTNQNAFIVLHTMGNHFDYSKRYPDSFDQFKPSGKTISIRKPSIKIKDVIINTYDNSILYADYILYSVIRAVQKQHAISTVFYVSDHGENLFSLPDQHFDEHTQPTLFSLHVPLFVWTSPEYDKAYPEKKDYLLRNKAKKIGSENIFYSLLDLANISFPGFDSTKSFVNRSFIESTQHYYNMNTKMPGDSKTLYPNQPIQNNKIENR